MDYHIAFAPELGLSFQEFIAAWNDTPDCRAIAEAQLVVQPSKGFHLDPQLVHDGLVLLTGAVGGFALDVLKDVVKDKIVEYLKQKLAKKSSVKVEDIHQPNGDYLLIVMKEEE